MSEDSKQNVYEQKIKEDDQRRAKAIQSQKAMIRNLYVVGLCVALPIFSLLGFVLLKSFELEKNQIKKVEEEKIRSNLMSKKPKIPLKRLFY